MFPGCLAIGFERTFRTEPHVVCRALPNLETVRDLGNCLGFSKSVEMDLKKEPSCQLEKPSSPDACGVLATLRADLCTGMEQKRGASGARLATISRVGNPASRLRAACLPQSIFLLNIRRAYASEHTVFCKQSSHDSSRI